MERLGEASGREGLLDRHERASADFGAGDRRRRRKRGGQLRGEEANGARVRAAVIPGQAVRNILFVVMRIVRFGVRVFAMVVIGRAMIRIVLIHGIWMRGVLVRGQKQPEPEHQRKGGEDSAAEGHG